MKSIETQTSYFIGFFCFDSSILLNCKVFCLLAILQNCDLRFVEWNKYKDRKVFMGLFFGIYLFSKHTREIEHIFVRNWNILSGIDPLRCYRSFIEIKCFVFSYSKYSHIYWSLYVAQRISYMVLKLIVYYQETSYGNIYIFKRKLMFFLIFDTITYIKLLNSKKYCQSIKYDTIQWNQYNYFLQKGYYLSIKSHHPKYKNRKEYCGIWFYAGYSNYIKIYKNIILKFHNSYEMHCLQHF